MEHIILQCKPLALSYSTDELKHNINGYFLHQKNCYLPVHTQSLVLAWLESTYIFLRDKNKAFVSGYGIRIISFFLSLTQRVKFDQ